MDFEIERMAVVSNGHLPPEELEILTNLVTGEYPDGLPGMADDYGVTVFTLSGAPEDAPNAALILKTAKQKNIQWVKFDCDGPVYDELPTFKW